MLLNAVPVLCRIATALMLLAAGAVLEGCGSDRAASGPPAATATPRAPANAPAMAGRWMLSSGGGSCAMNFAGAAGAGEGTIAPEGGCPGNFFTSRKWAFEGEALILRNHLGENLAQMRVATPDRFEGQTAAGQPLSLSR
jgi:Protease inhibitor Inh